MTTTKRAKARPEVKTEDADKAPQVATQNEPQVQAPTEVKTISGNIVVRH